MTDEKRPILRLPLKNFKFVGEFTEADSEWWQSYGRHLEAAQQDFDRRLHDRPRTPS